MNKTKVGIQIGALWLAGLALTAPAAGAAGCPNEALREAQGATSLPGCMALEMVSPPRKFSQRAHLPSFSRNGERVLMRADAALADTPGYQFGVGGDTYIASRGATGWSLAATTPPDTTVLGGGPRFGNPATYTPELEHWTQLASTQAQYQVGVTRLYAGGLDGSFAPLSPLLEPIDDSDSSTLVRIVNAMEIAGSSPGLEVTVFRPRPASTAYFPEDPRGALEEPGKDRNSYLAFLEGGVPTLQLLARDKDDKVWGGRCGAHLGGEETTFNQGAISPDGQRILFSTRPAQEWKPEEGKEPPCDTNNGLRILERVATPEGPVIAEISSGDPEAPGDDLFQGASADGSKVYFTSPRKLTATDADAATGPCSAVLGASKGCDLYLYDSSLPPGEQFVQVSDPEGPGSADVLSSITAISGDGSRAYFVAQGVLTADTNPEGDSAVAGEPNLYLYEAATGTTRFIGVLSDDDAGGMWGTAGTLFGDAYAAPLYGPGLVGGGDGNVLAFASKAPLTDGDADSGHRDVFRYDAVADTLQRVSEAAAGGSDDGPFDAAVNPAIVKGVEYNFGEATRWVSEDGQLIAFATKEALVPGDTDGLTNPYAWSSGQLGTVAAELTTLGGPVKAPGTAPVGGQMVFSTQTALLGSDGDGAEDVYVAREGGGFPEPVPPPVCDPLQEGSCQGPPPPALAAGSLATVNPSAGNVKALPRCKKGFLRRKGRCVKKKSHKRKAAKRAGHRRGGSR